MFPSLFKPKWEHPEAAVREAACAGGEVPAEVLARLATGDPAPPVRAAAAARLADLAVLARLATAEGPEPVRESALARLAALLAGPEGEGPAVAARVAFLAAPAEPGLAAQLARTAAVAEVRIAALAQVADPDVLRAIACGDPVAAVRQSAFARVTDPAAWEHIARETRDRDHQLSRLARERLEAHARASADRARAEATCAALEALASGVADPGPDYRRLLREWETIESPLPEDLCARWEAARALAAGAVARREAVEAARRGLCEELEGLRDLASPDSAEGAEALAGCIRAALGDVAGRWAAVGPGEPDESPLAGRFSALAAGLEGRAAEAERDAHRARAREALVREAEALAAAEALPDPGRLRSFEARWQALESPASEALGQALEAAFQGAIEALRGRLEHDAAHRRQALEEAEAELAPLEASLAGGALHDALRHLDRIRHRLKVAGQAERGRQARVERRLHRLQPRVEELRRWRHWGSSQAREELCTEIEALVGSALAAAEVAAKVRSAREAWQHIDRDEGPAPQALWQRFDDACTRAYEPFREELQRQARAREQHLEAKRALIVELEAFERATDWERPDWREADRRVRDARRHWQRIGPVPRKAVKAAERELAAVLGRLEAHLGAERERELERRRALIDRVRKLAEAADVGAAVREAREAQQRWRPTVPADQREEKALWDAFQEVRDAVFGRANAVRAEADAGRREGQARREAVCAALEALLAGEALDSPEVGRQARELERAWREAGPVPREAERSLEARYRGLQQRLADGRRAQARARDQARLDGLLQRGELCAEVEARALAGPVAEVEAQALLDAVRGRWAGLPALDPEDETALSARRDRAAAALSDAAARDALAAALPGNLAEGLALCLELEVLAGAESPPEHREDRMRFQVARLAETLRERRADAPSPAERARAIARTWAVLGPVPSERWPALRERFEAARAAARSLGEST
jgi:hypothetical protein